jgi:amidase
VEASAKLCADLGHTVEEANLKIDREQIVGVFAILWSAGCASILKSLGVKKDQVEPLTWTLGEMGSHYDAADYVNALQTLQRVSRDVARFFLDYDVLLTPTLAEPPVALGTFDSPLENPLHGFHRSGLFAPFTPLYNITGQPAMSVPLFWNADNLPVGSHFVGRFGDEATLFQLAAQLERAQPWAGRRPPVSV